MIKYLFALIALLVLASCSAPKYTYSFDHYNYHAGKKMGPNNSMQADHETPLNLREEIVTADLTPSIDLKNTTESSSKLQQHRSIDVLSAAEKKELRSALKKEFKNAAKKFKSSDEGAHIEATKQLDDELKLAIIFGAIGITLTVLGGISAVFWILGVIGLAVGLVFFIRWISRQ